MTNLLQFLPDNPVTDTLDAVLTLLKHVAFGVVEGLEGLSAMDPNGSYLGRLNAAGTRHGTAQYFAVASDYQPPPGSPLATVTRNLATDLIFGNDGNDLVVPTEGAVPPVDNFPVADALIFPPMDSVAHSSYCGRRLLGRFLVDALTGPAA